MRSSTESLKSGLRPMPGGDLEGASQGQQTSFRDRNNKSYRNRYSFVPVTCRDEDGVVARRQHLSIRERNREVGVLSDAYHPYRPLGTPVRFSGDNPRGENTKTHGGAAKASGDGPDPSVDVSASMPDLRAHGFYRPRVGMASRHPDEMPRQEGEAPVPYKAVQRPVMGENGFDALWDAVKVSDARKNSVRSGQTIGSAVHEGPSALRSRPGRRKKSQARPPPKLKLPAIKGAVEAPGESAPDMDEGQDEAVLDKYFNPASSVSVLRKDFEHVRGHAKRRVENALKIQDESRDNAFKYKIESLSKLDKESKNPAGFSQEKWRLEADKRRLQAQLNAIHNHDWFLSLMEILASERHVSQPAEHVVGEIKKVVEAGESFDLFDFLTMAACVPVEYHYNSLVRRIFDYVREAVGLSLQRYIDFLDKQDIEVDQELLQQLRLEKEAIGHSQNMRKTNVRRLNSRSKAIQGILSTQTGNNQRTSKSDTPEPPESPDIE